MSKNKRYLTIYKFNAKFIATVLDYNNKIGIVSINEIQGMDFMIPNYQRGYRWEELQVRELLKDCTILLNLQLLDFIVFNH